MTSSGPSSLHAHLQALDEIQNVILEENSWLRSKQAPPPEELLERKRRLSGRLDDAVAFLRDFRDRSEGFLPEDRNRLREARRRMMKIFYVDRENEQLLLKCSVSRATPPKAQSVNQVLLHHTYRNGEKPREQP